MTNEAAPSLLAGRTILVVEDEMMLMMLIEGALEDAGCQLLAASRVSTAIPLARSARLDCAILDVNVAGEVVYPVAEILRNRGIPFVLATGYGETALPEKWRAVPRLAKPYFPEELTRAILAIAPAH